MAGEAKTSAFMLGTATVMLGAQSDLFDLNPEDHSIGLVKNFRVTAEPSYTDLSQGVRNQIVYSVMTQNIVRAAMEAYEYTASNLAYALGLEGSNFAAQTVTTTLTAAAIATDVALTVDDETGFAVGNWVLIQDGADDQVYTRKLTAVAATTLTFAEPLPKPLAIGATVRKASMIDVGTKAEQPFLSAKVIGTIADGTEVALLCPKIRITNGFSVGFTTENFDNLPFEFSFYDLLASDPFFASMGNSQAKLLTTK
jgi:hypothetical protein